MRAVAGIDGAAARTRTAATASIAQVAATRALK
jgi:hypothetical protein